MSIENLIIKKLDTIIALLATQGQDENRKIKILKSLGFSSEGIIKLTGVPART
jgi:hypothetical protein